MSEVAPALLRHKLAALERSQAIVELDLDGIVLCANQSFLQLMGYLDDQVTGRSYSMFAPATESHACEYDRLLQQLRNGEHAAGEFCRLHASGDQIWVLGAYCPVLKDLGQLRRPSTLI
ncbi:PAS domain-containing protein [Bradyrhizobium sp. BR13661]|jgi:methyl-accepting chemotaxis protein|uniref:PAS domain-containing protein n=1 Tax=Bradyrhizobium sp. BR13661 TaxID=2940622 RepID=UPI002475E7D7|nr:PAS domain-containing protein [Bradyrhizobium sp. BR13661]MDH6261249.1 PAS domain S-box-containing protein [Bradyrhizobium sp. BR13661]